MSRRKVHDTSCSIFHHILNMDNYSDYIKQVHINVPALFGAVHINFTNEIGDPFFKFCSRFLFLCSALFANSFSILFESIVTNRIFVERKKNLSEKSECMCNTREHHQNDGILPESRFYRKKEPKEKQTPYSTRWPMSVWNQVIPISYSVHRSSFSHVKLPILHGINFVYSVFFCCCWCAQPFVVFSVNLLARWNSSSSNWQNNDMHHFCHTVLSSWIQRYMSLWFEFVWPLENVIPYHWLLDKIQI